MIIQPKKYVTINPPERSISFDEIYWAMECRKAAMTDWYLQKRVGMALPLDVPAIQLALQSTIVWC